MAKPRSTRPRRSPLAVGAGLSASSPQARLLPLIRAAALLGLLFTAGVVGFKIVGGPEHDLVDAIYMTTITLTTVGYEEAIDLSHSPGGKVFASLLLVFGVGAFIFFFSNLTAFMVDGGIDRILMERKMRRAIENLSDHYIVCGAGQAGRHVVADLLDTGRPFVVVDGHEERLRELQEDLGHDFPVIVGDATDDEILEAAAIGRARGLIACISNDKDNLIVTVSARLLNRELRIVSRCRDPGVEKKIRAAGADAVVSPQLIGGLRLVSEMVRPTVVSFLDIMLRDRDRSLRVEEVAIDEGHPLAGASVGSVRARKIPDLLVLAVRYGSGDWHYNPDDDVRLEPGTTLVFMGSPSARVALEPDSSRPQGSPRSQGESQEREDPKKPALGPPLAMK